MEIIPTELIALCNRLDEGKWSAGRPVFKKVGGEERFLLVGKGEHENGWIIKTSTTAGRPKISSGRATNSPESPEAGPSVKDGVTRWRYWDGDWMEGDISVTCL